MQITLVLTAITILLLGCKTTGEQLTPATPVPTVMEQRIDFWESDLSTAQSSANAEEGSRIEIVVKVVEESESESSRCAKPAVHDTFGNMLAVLAPVLENTEQNFESRSPPPAGYERNPNRTRWYYSYRYSLYAPESGRYTVHFDNQECNVRKEPAEATITWRIHPPS